MNRVLDLGAIKAESAARAESFTHRLGDALSDPFEITGRGGGIGLMGARLVPEGEDGDGIRAGRDCAYREEACENASKNCCGWRALHILV